jgi:cell division control protein 7
MARQRGVELSNFPIHEDHDQQDQGASDVERVENDSASEVNTTREDDSSIEEEMEETVAEDIQRFQDSFKGIGDRYRLISRIGEGILPVQHIMF